MDKLDQLLALYTGRCVDDEAEYFLSVDVSGIEYNEEIKKRMLRYAFKRSRYERKRYAVKVILVACLVAMSVVFTACVSIPKIREAIWGAMIEWYDDHISVKFEEITEQTTETSKSAETDDGNISTKDPSANTTNTNAEVKVTPPQTIQHKVYIANLPEQYHSEITIDSRLYYTTNFYYNGQLQFCLTQMVLDDRQNCFDVENERVIELEIKGYPAILLEDEEQNGVYTIYWTDGIYSYTLYGIFDSLYDLLTMVSQVSLIK